MLYIINQFPVLPSSIDNATDGDTIIFTANAVYAAKQGNNDNLLRTALKHMNFYVRKTDLMLRHIAQKDLLSGINILDEVDYLNITNEDAAIRSWN